jgi:hypothetical protein
MARFTTNAGYSPVHQEQTASPSAPRAQGIAQFTASSGWFDPYRNFKFLMKWDGRYLAGVSKNGALSRSMEVVERRRGGDSSSIRESPGQTQYEAIALERGVAHDMELKK